MDPFTNTDELLDSFRAGDKAAYATICEKFYPRLVEYSCQIIYHESLAREIAGESLAKLFKRSHTCLSTEHVESLLFVAVRNASLSYLRTLKTFKENYEEYVSRIQKDNRLDSLTLEKLFQEIQRLPDRSRHLVNYLYVQRMSGQKAAALMETTVENIENLRASALKKLKDNLFPSYSPAVSLTFFSFLMNS